MDPEAPAPRAAYDYLESVLAATLALLPDDPRDDREPARQALQSCCAAVGRELARLHGDATATGDTRALMHAVLDLAAVLAALGLLEHAYNAAIGAVALAPPAGALTEKAVRSALALAVEGGTAIQQATCEAMLASALVIAADAAPDRRLEAFDACERAIERLMRIGPPMQPQLAAGLYQAMSERDYLRLPACALLLFLPDADRYRGAAAQCGLHAWQPRVAAGPLDDWLQAVRHYLDDNRLWFAVEDARAALLPPADDELHVAADWTHWTIDHPAYRHVIPHHRSFLRERRLGHNLLVLTHEMTHVLCFLGAIGEALCALRTAAFHDETALWQNPDAPADDSTPLAQRFAREGVAPLPPGQAAALVRTEHALELALKAHALHDAWTPWFEGLAVFAETAADPMHDESIIDPVNNALRNLIDVYPEAGASDADVLRQAIDAFQARTAAALAEAGPRRLNRALRSPEPSYRAGYLAVRAVLARWRRTAARPISGAEAFRVLLHATRFGTSDALPDLALPAARFAEEAADRMAAWVVRLARLTRAELALAIGLDDSAAPGTNLRWADGRPCLATGDGRAAADARVRDLLRQAFAGLSAPEDIGRIRGADEFLSHTLEYAAWTLRNQSVAPGFDKHFDSLANLAKQTFFLGSLLPVGRCVARFFLNHRLGRDHGALVTVLRTTEDHVDGGGSSMNLFAAILEADSVQRLAAAAEHEASPRLEVSRIVDLTGMLTRDIGQAGMHLMTYRLGDWFEVRGTTDATQRLLDARPALKSDLTTLLRARLYPNPQQAAESRLAESTPHSARRTLDWIEGTTQWRIGSEPIAAEPWADHVRALARRLLDDAHGPQREAAARRLLGALWDEPATADAITAQDFETMTSAVPAARHDIVEALFATGHGHGGEHKAAAAALRRCPGRLLRRYGHGWDVRAAG